jgi:hypothetical protein
MINYSQNLKSCRRSIVEQFIGLTLFIIFVVVMVIVLTPNRKRTKKSSARNITTATNSLGPPREPLSSFLRRQVYYRANRQCENPFCHDKGQLEIHHIDMNHNNNKLYNLIALCPSCHTGAHSGKFPPTQVHNWMNMDYQQLIQRQKAQNSTN